jgi:FG-GAP-like repeat
VRHRILPALLTAMLAAPAAGAIAATIATVAAPTAAGAVSTSPAWSDQTTGWWDRSSSPTIADIDGDGTNDIVIGGQNAVMHVISGANGHDIAHWPQNAVVSGAPTAIDSTPAVADLFKNGKKEIVVGAGSTWQPNHNGGVIVFNPDGSEHCVFHTLDNGNPWANNGTPSGYTQPVFSSPAIGDIDGDGFPDIVFGSFDGHIYGISRNCTKILDENIEDSIWSSPALYDIDGDGRKEIFIGGDQAAGGAIDWSGGEFRSVKWVPGAPGNAVELWKRQVDDTVWSSPAIGDIDGDGRVEVVVGDGFFYHRTATNQVFAWHADDGSSLGGWPVTTGGQTMSSPALGDLTGDGIPEVVVASGNGYVQAYRGNSSLVWATQLRFNGAPDGAPVASPIIADMNGDGHNDVGAGNDFGYYVMNGQNGGIMSQHNIWLSHETAGAVGNFGSAGWKLIVSGFQTPAPHENALEAFNMPAPGVTPPWPEMRHDAAHLAGPVGHNLLPPGYCSRPLNPTPHPNPSSSAGYWVASANGSVYALHGAPYKGNANGRVHGNVVGIGATHSGNGYYLLDSAGFIFPFGDAVSYGSEAGKRLNAPIIALAPTPSGHGYWLLGRDGGVFTFGDARFFGSTGSMHLNAPIISMAPTTDGRGYWLLGADGGVFTYGDARFRGSTGGMRLNAPVISMATAPSGAGYWLVAKDGGVFSFHVPFYGSLPGSGLCRMPQGVQIRPTLTGNGYYMLAANGSMWAFGDAQSGGSAPPLPITNVATDLAVRP